jgi:hypothetical protein
MERKKLTQEEEDKFDELYNKLWEYLLARGQNPNVALTTKQIRDFLLIEENLEEKEINKFIKYLKDEGQSIESSNSSNSSTNSSSNSSSNSSNSIFRSRSSSHSDSLSPIIKPNSTHTLLFNCCHGVLETTNINKYNKILKYFKNPIQSLNRLIEGAQLCITSHYASDDVNIMKELKKKNWNSLNSENIDEAKEIVQNVKGYKEKTIKPQENPFYYNYLFRKNQLHNRLQYITNTIDEKIINKRWGVEIQKEKKMPNGIFFVNKTTFIVPKMNKPYIKGGFDEHFNYKTNQITYTIFDNILTCPIYTQFNNFCYKQNIPEQKTWEYNVHTDTYVYGEMISYTGAFVLFNYLANIPNVSMIDTSCEVYNDYNEVNKLKALRDSYRKLGPKVGKKLVKQITKKIYRLENKLRTTARGKRRNTRKK